MVLNCGSSSVKCRVLNPVTREVSLTCIADRLNTDRPRIQIKAGEGEERSLPLEKEKDAITKACEIISHEGISFQAIGHRIVHGGDHFDRSALIDGHVVSKIRDAAVFAPLHNETSLAGVEAVAAAFPGLPQVAVFDTAFHSSMPRRAREYAIPPELAAGIKIRRYGFHGTSHLYAYGEAQRLMGGGEGLRVATAHLGNGCSVAAVRGGRSMDTTMGMTPLEGLMMGTRSGDVDPTLFRLTEDNLGWDVRRTLDCLNGESGFLGVAGTADSREVEERCADGCKRARAALEMFCYRVSKAIASYVVPMGGIDAVVFTGGIGEKSAMKRCRMVEMLRPLGFELDGERNKAHGAFSNGFVTTDESAKKVLVVKADEELIIARETIKVIKNYDLD